MASSCERMRLKILSEITSDIESLHGTSSYEQAPLKTLLPQRSPSIRFLSGRSDAYKIRCTSVPLKRSHWLHWVAPIQNVLTRLVRESPRRESHVENLSKRGVKRSIVIFIVTNKRLGKVYANWEGRFDACTLGLSEKNCDF